MSARARGAALLLVLWLVALLTALIGAFALTARIESLQARVLSTGAVAQEQNRFPGNNLNHFASTNATVFLGPEARNNSFLGHFQSVVGNVAENTVRGSEE